MTVLIGKQKTTEPLTLSMFNSGTGKVEKTCFQTYQPKKGLFGDPTDTVLPTVFSLTKKQYEQLRDYETSQYSEYSNSKMVSNFNPTVIYAPSGEWNLINQSATLNELRLSVIKTTRNPYIHWNAINAVITLEDFEGIKFNSGFEFDGDGEDGFNSELLTVFYINKLFDVLKEIPVEFLIKELYSNDTSDTKQKVLRELIETEHIRTNYGYLRLIYDKFVNLGEDWYRSLTALIRSLLFGNSVTSANINLEFINFLYEEMTTGDKTKNKNTKRRVLYYVMEWLKADDVTIYGEFIETYYPDYVGIPREWVLEMLNHDDEEDDDDE